MCNTEAPLSGRLPRTRIVYKTILSAMSNPPALQLNRQQQHLVRHAHDRLFEWHWFQTEIQQLRSYMIQIDIKSDHAGFLRRVKEISKREHDIQTCSLYTWYKYLTIKAQAIFIKTPIFLNNKREFRILFKIPTCIVCLEVDSCSLISFSIGAVIVWPFADVFLLCNPEDSGVEYWIIIFVHKLI